MSVMIGVLGQMIDFLGVLFWELEGGMVLMPVEVFGVDLVGVEIGRDVRLRLGEFVHVINIVSRTFKFNKMVLVLYLSHCFKNQRFQPYNSISVHYFDD